jgi:hypothetical protein
MPAVKPTGAVSAPIWNTNRGPSRKNIPAMPLTYLQAVVGELEVHGAFTQAAPQIDGELRAEHP